MKWNDKILLRLSSGKNEIDEVIEKLRRIAVLDKTEICNCLRSLVKSSSRALCCTLDASVVRKILFGKKLRFLCKIDSKRSCAGCCDDFTKSPNDLGEKYRSRKEAFRDLVRRPEDLSAYGKHVREAEQSYTQCPFVSFIDEDNCSVGCLLHPLSRINRGNDYRNYGKYGAPLCSAYVCSAIKTLERAPAESRLVFLYLMEYTDDWYHYSRLFSPSVTHSCHRGLVEILLSAWNKCSTRPVPGTIIS